MTPVVTWFTRGDVNIRQWRRQTHHVGCVTVVTWLTSASVDTKKEKRICCETGFAKEKTLPPRISFLVVEKTSLLQASSRAHKLCSVQNTMNPIFQALLGTLILRYDARIEFWNLERNRCDPFTHEIKLHVNCATLVRCTLCTTSSKAECRICWKVLNPIVEDFNCSRGTKRMRCAVQRFACETQPNWAQFNPLGANLCAPQVVGLRIPEATREFHFPVFLRVGRTYLPCLWRVSKNQLAESAN